MSMDQAYRRLLMQGMQGQNARQFEANALTRARQQAMAVGAGNAAVSPALAARQAGQAAAAQTAQVGMQAAQMRMQEQDSARNAAAQQLAADQSRMDRLLGAGLGAAGTGLSMLLTSDERAKQGVGDGRGAVDRLIRALEPQRFEYRDGSGPPGARLGVMAQDVQRAAPELVGRQPDGMRGLDRDAALSALLASVGRLGERVDGMERRGGRR